MSKIVQAVNSMVNNKEKITNVGELMEDIYFLYDKKYKWSMARKEEDDDYLLFYYKTEASIEQLESNPEPEPDIEFVRYSAREIGTKEAFNSFRALFLILKEKKLGIDEVLDDIIGDDIPF